MCPTDRWFRISVDVEAVRKHLSREDAASYSRDDVFQWLRDAGFIQEGDSWLTSEANLGQLDPAEVLTIDLVSPPPGR